MRTDDGRLRTDGLRRGFLLLFVHSLGTAVGGGVEDSIEERHRWCAASWGRTSPSAGHFDFCDERDESLAAVDREPNYADIGASRETARTSWLSTVRSGRRQACGEQAFGPKRCAMPASTVQAINPFLRSARHATSRCSPARESVMSNRIAVSSSSWAVICAEPVYRLLALRELDWRIGRPVGSVTRGARAVLDTGAQSRNGQSLGDIGTFVEKPSAAARSPRSTASRAPTTNRAMIMSTAPSSAPSLKLSSSNRSASAVSPRSYSSTASSAPASRAACECTAPALHATRRAARTLLGALEIQLLERGDSIQRMSAHHAQGPLFCLR